MSVDILFLSMAGRRGAIVHAVRATDAEQDVSASALCGRWPASQWAEERHEGVTCPRCASALKRARKASGGVQ